MKTQPRTFKVLILTVFGLAIILTSCRLQNVENGFRLAGNQKTQLSGSDLKAASRSGNILKWVSDKINSGSGFGFSESDNYAGNSTVGRIRYSDYSDKAEIGVMYSANVMNTLVRVQTMADSQNRLSEDIHLAQESVNQYNKKVSGVVDASLAQYRLRETDYSNVQIDAAAINKLKNDKISAEEARAALSNSGMSLEAARQKYTGY